MYIAFAKCVTSKRGTANVWMELLTNLASKVSFDDLCHFASAVPARKQVLVSSAESAVFPLHTVTAATAGIGRGPGKQQSRGSQCTIISKCTNA